MAGLFDREQPEPAAEGEAKPLDVTTEGSVSLTLRANWEIFVTIRTAAMEL